MNCCMECFRDSEIRAIIKSKNQIGDCDFCSLKNVYVYDVSSDPNPIADMIISLMDIHAISDSADAKLLKDTLHDNWDIFNVGAKIIQELTQKLSEATLIGNKDIFTYGVDIPRISTVDFLNDFGIVRGFTWSEFSESIKYANRFHNQMFNPDAFASFLLIGTKSYPAGSRFYRARISKFPKGYTQNEMGTPPKDKRSAGRINPEGVGVLYLSSDEITVLNEVRASAFDYITIGEFINSHDIKVVNLSGIAKISPFLYERGLEQFAANRKAFQEIEAEIAKPLRRNDSPIEYLPTQFISEFIKSQNYDGVEYKSTLNESGSNVAVFDESLFSCVDVKTIEVTEVSYKTQPDL